MDLPTGRLPLLQRLLRPVARICLLYGFSIQELIEATKLAYITVAKEEMERRGEKCNVSRLSVMSGLHRRDVARLVEQPPVEDVTVGTVNRVIGQWCHDSRFCTRIGKPKMLQHRAEKDQFSQLVHSVSQDLHPGTVLFELKRRSVIEESERGLSLKVHVLNSCNDHSEGLQMLAEDCDDLCSAVLKNLSSDEPCSLHSKTEFDRIPAAHAPKIQKWLLTRGASFQREVREHLAALDLDVNGKRHLGPTVRVALGVFSTIDDSNIRDHRNVSPGN